MSDSEEAVDEFESADEGDGSEKDEDLPSLSNTTDQDKNDRPIDVTEGDDCDEDTCTDAGMVKEEAQVKDEETCSAAEAVKEEATSSSQKSAHASIDLHASIDPGGIQALTLDEPENKEISIKADANDGVVQGVNTSSTPDKQEVIPASHKPDDKREVKSDATNDPPPPVHTNQPVPLNDASPDRESVLENLNKAADNQSTWGGGWGSWGSSLLTSTVSSVATFTSQVGDGFNVVLEQVESSLGAPDPIELVRQDRDARRVKEPNDTPNGGSQCSQEDIEDVQDGAVEQVIERAGGSGTESGDELNPDGEGATGGEAEDDDGWGGWGAWGSNITKQVQNTGASLVHGGLDVLETVGKKAYDVIAEGDHGLKNTIKTNKVNLSQTLRDAKDQYDENSKEREEFEEARKAHFGSLFDEYNGLVHLEALELISGESEGRVAGLLSTLPPEQLDQIKPTLIIIRNTCHVAESDDEEEESVEEQDFGAVCRECNAELGLAVSADKLLSVSSHARTWLTDCSEEQESGVRQSLKEVHCEGIKALAEITACSVQHYHKVAQLLQLNPQDGTLSSFTEKAVCLERLNVILRKEVDLLSNKFTDCLTSTAESSEDQDEVNAFITNIYLEASNSKSYIGDAFQLLLPVLQHSILTLAADT